MPRVRREGKVKRGGWTEEHVTQLLSGRDWFGRAFGDRALFRQRLDLEALAEAWEELGPDLLREWKLRHPRTRPWAWWILEAPECRKRKDGRPVDCKPEDSYFGRPRLTDRPESEDEYETQSEFLERLDIED